MSFSFGFDENVKVNATVGNYFKPYTVNKIDTIKVEKKTGKKKEGGDWLALNVTYSLNGGGSVSKMYFYDDNDKDGTTRGEYNGQPCFPSSYEIIKQLAIHVLGNYNPAAFEKFRKFVATKVKNMNQFIDGFVKLVNDNSATGDLFIKVIGRKDKGTNRIYSDVPAPCAVSKTNTNAEDPDNGKYVHHDEKGQVVPNDTYIINFLSNKEDGLTFTAGELKKQAEYAKAKPTVMSDDSNDDINNDLEENNDDLDINVDDLDDDIENLNL